MDPDPDFRIGSGFLADPDPDSEKRSDPDLDPGKKPGSETLKKQVPNLHVQHKNVCRKQGLGNTDTISANIFYLSEIFS